jgi:hypothetical protein
MILFPQLWTSGIEYRKLFGNKFACAYDLLLLLAVQAFTGLYFA